MYANRHQNVVTNWRYSIRAFQWLLLAADSTGRCNSMVKSLSA
jgi:hypothetical protein